MKEISFHFVVTVFVLAEAGARIKTSAFNQPNLLKNLKSASLAQTSPLLTSFSYRSTKLFSKDDTKLSTKIYYDGETNDGTGTSRNNLWDSPWESSMVISKNKFDSNHYDMNANKRMRNNDKACKELKNYYEANAFVANEVKWGYSTENARNKSAKKSYVHAFFVNNSTLANKELSQSKRSTFNRKNLITESRVYHTPKRPPPRQKSTLTRFLVSYETSTLKDHMRTNNFKDSDIDTTDSELESNYTIIEETNNETKTSSLIKSEATEKLLIQAEQSVNITESKEEASIQTPTESETGAIQDLDTFVEIEQEPLEVIGDWGAYYDDDDDEDTESIYFYNRKTGESTWEPPSNEFTCISFEEEEEDIVRAPNQLHIESACKVLPHPDKIEWGGEDAILLHGRTFGVFDGVSGAHKQNGIPLYSITLAEQMQKLVLQNHDNIVATNQESNKNRSIGLTMSKLSSYLEQSIDYADQFATGASTAIVASLGEDNYLRVLNIGDSSLIIIRDSEVVSRSENIIHFFNCPFQFAVYSSDSPSDGTKMNVEIIPGDIIVMASDGVFDNLDNQAIIDAVKRDPEHASRMVRNIVEDARRVSLDPQAETPFGNEEKKSKVEMDDASCIVDEVEGFGLGGKIDDISCIVLRILSPS